MEIRKLLIAFVALMIVACGIFCDVQAQRVKGKKNRVTAVKKNVEKNAKKKNASKVAPAAVSNENEERKYVNHFDGSVTIAMTG
ncbi:MAG: hypothetical protein IJK68_03250, partial [Muribaculaceae bacterium]|nr:hypothetical protein [Muribaculaceae bacterium]